MLWSNSLSGDGMRIATLYLRVRLPYSAAQRSCHDMAIQTQPVKIEEARTAVSTRLPLRVLAAYLFKCRDSLDWPASYAASSTLPYPSWRVRDLLFLALGRCIRCSMAAHASGRRRSASMDRATYMWRSSPRLCLVQGNDGVWAAWRHARGISTADSDPVNGKQSMSLHVRCVRSSGLHLSARAAVRLN